MKKFFFSIEEVQFKLKTDENGNWVIEPAADKDRSASLGFYLQPARAAVQSFLERVPPSYSVSLSFETDLTSHTFSQKSLREWLRRFSLYTDGFQRGIKKLSEVLSHPRAFILCRDQSFESGESHFFGQVRESSLGLEVLPLSVEWLTFFLLGEGLYARSLVKPERGLRGSWKVFLAVPRPIKNIAREKEPEELSQVRSILQERQKGCSCKRPLKRRERVFVQFKISSACNFSCDFCYYKRNLELPRFIDLERTLPVMKEFFRRFNQSRGAGATVLLHGGEPLMHPDVKGLCRRIGKELEGLLSEEEPFSMTTNGFLLSQKREVFSCLAHATVSFNTDRFEGKERLYEGFVKSLKEVYPQYRQQISFLSLIGLESPESLCRAYEKLMDDIGAKAVRFSAERLVSEDAEESFSLSHRRFLEENLKLLELTEKRSDLIFHPKLYLSGRPSFVVHGCGNCSLPNIFDIDCTVRVCAKNYEIPPVFAVEVLSEAMEAAKGEEEFLSLMSFLSLGEERTLRQVVCTLLGCDLSDFCSTGCVNFPTIDQSGVCAMLMREAL